LDDFFASENLLEITPKVEVKKRGRPFKKKICAPNDSLNSDNSYDYFDTFDDFNDLRSIIRLQIVLMHFQIVNIVIAILDFSLLLPI
jgi:hypothetical protein